MFTRSSPTPFARFMSLHDLTPAHLSKSQTHLQHPFYIMFYLVFPVSVNATTTPPLFLLLILQSNERLEGLNLPVFLHILGGPVLAREPAKATAQTTSANLNLIMFCTCLKSSTGFLLHLQSDPNSLLWAFKIWFLHTSPVHLMPPYPLLTVLQAHWLPIKSSNTTTVPTSGPLYTMFLCLEHHSSTPRITSSGLSLSLSLF